MGWAWPGLISAIGRCMPLISPRPLLWCNWIQYLLRWKATQKTCNEVLCSVADGSMRGPFRLYLCNTGAWQACLPANLSGKNNPLSMQEIAHLQVRTSHAGKFSRIKLLSLSTYSTMARLAAAWHLRGVKTRICLMYTESN